MIKYISCILGFTDNFRDFEVNIKITRTEEAEIIILIILLLLVTQFSIIWVDVFFPSDTKSNWNLVSTFETFDKRVGWKRLRFSLENIGRKVGENKIGEDSSTMQNWKCICSNQHLHLSNAVGIWNRKLNTELWGKHWGWKFASYSLFLNKSKTFFFVQKRFFV